MFVNYNHPDELQQQSKRAQVKRLTTRLRHISGRAQRRSEQHRNPSTPNPPYSPILSAQDDQLGNLFPGAISSEPNVSCTTTRSPEQPSSVYRERDFPSTSPYSPQNAFDAFEFSAFDFSTRPFNLQTGGGSGDEPMIVFAIREFLGGTPMKEAMMMVIFPFVMQNPVVTEATLALGLAYTARNHPIDALLLHNVQLRRQSVLQTLRKRISDPSLAEATDDITIHTALVLLAIERAIGNMEDLDIHRAGLAKIIELRGGFQSLGLQGAHREIAIALVHNYERPSARLNKTRASSDAH